MLLILIKFIQSQKCIEHLDKSSKIQIIQIHRYACVTIIKITLIHEIVPKVRHFAFGYILLRIPSFRLPPFEPPPIFASSLRSYFLASSAP